jgi:hypothetical protein
LQGLENTYPQYNIILSHPDQHDNNNAVKKILSRKFHRKFQEIISITDGNYLQFSFHQVWLCHSYPCPLHQTDPVNLKFHQYQGCSPKPAVDSTVLSPKVGQVIVFTSQSEVQSINNHHLKIHSVIHLRRLGDHTSDRDFTEDQINI